MSYRRSFHKRVAVHYSGSVSYPASQHGGSVSYSGTAYEDVTVNIDVETDPFDRSVAGCNTNVGLLTGAVVATESAQIASIHENAKKIGKTIVSGFFNTVKSEISQQMSELSSRIDATLIHLRELSKRCIDKQRQMEVDYNRISSRYLKIFNELNSELENRIIELDRPSFSFKKEGDMTLSRSQGDTTGGASIIAGVESGDLHKMIGASLLKKQAGDTIHEIDRFLLIQKQLDTLLKRCIMDGDIESSIYAPVCFVETGNPDGSVERRAYHSKSLEGVGEQKLVAELSPRRWEQHLSKEASERIQSYFNHELSSHYASANQHEERVRNCISRLYNVDNTKSL